jgi:Phytanoyl-CoA dioxygenase (PhyH)
LNDVQRAAVDDLKRDGIAIVRFVDLFGEELWREACADIEPFIQETKEATRDVGERPAGKEEVIVRRFFHKAAKDGEGNGSKPAFAIGSPWLRIAASDLLLDVVNSYREWSTRLFYLDNWFTVPYPGAGERVASQQWHRDPEDEHILKVFVYFSDVDEEAGPFEYVRGSSAGGRYGDLWAWCDGHRYPPADELEGAVAPEDRLTVTGPAGTIILCDTGGFHRGGFARTKPRILSISTYRRAGRKKGKRRFTVDFAGREETLSPQARVALG